MLSHLGFSAWISCEDKALPEFEVHAISNRVTCWIPSKEGKAFVVHWRDDGSKIDTAAYITLDGFVVSGRFLFGQGKASRGGVRTGVSSERPFVFSKVDEEKEKGNPQLQIKSEGKTGMVMLRIKRIKRGEGKKPNDLQLVPEQVRGKRKYGDDCVGYGSERPTEFQQPSTWTVEPYDKANPGSYVTFVFRYRSPEFLEAQGIMTGESESTSPATPGLTDATATPPSSNPSPGTSLRVLRTVSGTSDCSEVAPSKPVEYARPVTSYPGEGLFWFNQDNQPTDVTQHLEKKSRTR